jgi:hypothetical protein
MKVRLSTHELGADNRSMLAMVAQRYSVEGKGSGESL